ncbi:hypothetical protein L798_05489 [Zootermopsis nevadensis]|uniref:Uncharacterized protein n=1 Tax=Zootermopsis nevadensis TaxID=136037 RepID=A0A067RJ21_ZOONE|nr:hypothetical protein L798_05489 [Zootermopsis nevadensis]
MAPDSWLGLRPVQGHCEAVREVSGTCYESAGRASSPLRGLFENAGGTGNFGDSCGGAPRKKAMPVSEKSVCSISTFIKEFPALFSDRPGTVRGRTCGIELSDDVPVRSPPRLIALR